MSTYYYNITYQCNSNCLFCAADYPINHDNRQMSMALFCNEMNKNSVGIGDQVIINGGEPTVHPDFLDILHKVHERGALIDLFSNGMRFSDEVFTNKVLQYKPINIRIPLFGSKAKIHDYYTGVDGSFNKVMKGLKHITSNLAGRAYLDIKLLLAKMLIDENVYIFNEVQPLLKNRNVRLSLNPLLISECIIKHSTEFFDSYTNMVKNSKILMDKAMQNNIRFSMTLIPFCTFPNELYIEQLCGRKSVSKMKYYDVSKNDYHEVLKGREKCLGCKYIKVCPGFPESYIKYYGDKEISPFFD